MWLEEYTTIGTRYITWDSISGQFANWTLAVCFDLSGDDHVSDCSSIKGNLFKHFLCKTTLLTSVRTHTHTHTSPPQRPHAHTHTHTHTRHRNTRISLTWPFKTGRFVGGFLIPFNLSTEELHWTARQLRCINSMEGNYIEGRRKSLFLLKLKRG